MHAGQGILLPFMCFSHTKYNITEHISLRSPINVLSELSKYLNKMSKLKHLQTHPYKYKY